MIYRCNKCDKEMRLMNGAFYCPICSEKIKPIDLEARIAKLYNDGKTEKEMATDMQITDIVVNQMLAKAALNGLVKIDDLIQTEFESGIKNVLNSSWDGLLKTVKKAVNESCTYTTINYYARKNKREQAEVKRFENEKKVTDIRNLLKRGISVQKIADTVHCSVFMVERILLEEIEKDKAAANAYIREEYKAKILGIVNNPEWNGKLKSIKDQLPKDVTYTNIKATIAKNR